MQLAFLCTMQASSHPVECSDLGRLLVWVPSPHGWAKVDDGQDYNFSIVRNAPLFTSTSIGRLTYPTCYKL